MKTSAKYFGLAVEP